MDMKLKCALFVVVADSVAVIADGAGCRSKRNDANEKQSH